MVLRYFLFICFVLKPVPVSVICFYKVSRRLGYHGNGRETALVLVVLYRRFHDKICFFSVKKRSIGVQNSMHYKLYFLTLYLNSVKQRAALQLTF